MGLILGGICQWLKIPRIIGMLMVGIVIGPYVLDLLDPSIMMISPDLRQIALVIILIKAGLSLNLADLKKVGRPAILMSFLPATFELLAFYFLAPYFFDITSTESAVMGAVLAAVSPAVVVPKMIHLIENKIGTKKSIPQMILAGASCDDVFVIVLFTTFLTMAQGGSASFVSLLNIPVSIVLGLALGGSVGFLLSRFFEIFHKNNRLIRNSKKVIVILGLSFLLISIETWLKDFVSVSGLLAVISMASILKIKSNQDVTKRLSEKFGKLWVFAEILLFVLIGSAVDIRYTLSAGIPALCIIFIALIFRSFGVFLCMIGTNLNFKEKLFSVIAYLPKATVQAAIGAIPLAVGLPAGKIILSVAVLAIIITAPLGAIGIDIGHKYLLEKED